MATTKKDDDISAPIAILLLFLVFAFAAGSIGGGGDDAGDGGISARSEDPCDGKDPDIVVRSWSVDGRTLYLRCGDEDEDGFRHIKSGHMGSRTSWRDVVRCIGRTVSRGTYRQGFRGEPGRVMRDFYTWEYEPGKVVEVVVHIRSGNIVTAFPRRGSWAGCAGR